MGSAGGKGLGWDKRTGEKLLIFSFLFHGRFSGIFDLFQSRRVRFLSGFSLSFASSIEVQHHAPAVFGFGTRLHHGIVAWLRLFWV